MVAGRHRLDHSVMPGVLSAGEQQGRLDLRRGEIEPVAGGNGGIEALDVSGSRSPSIRGADPPQRRRDPRPSAGGTSEASPVKVGADRVAGDEAHQQPRRRAANCRRSSARLRLEQAADADAVDASRRRPLRASIRAPIARSAAMVAATSRALVQALDPAAPDAPARRSISARWEIDLVAGNAGGAAQGPAGRNGRHGPWL